MERSDWIRKVVQEFQSPSFRGENMLQFEALLFAGLIAAGTRFRRVKVIDGLKSADTGRFINYDGSAIVW